MKPLLLFGVLCASVIFVSACSSDDGSSAGAGAPNDAAVEDAATVVDAAAPDAVVHDSGPRPPDAAPGCTYVGFQNLGAHSSINSTGPTYRSTLVDTSGTGIHSITVDANGFEDSDVGSEFQRTFAGLCAEPCGVNVYGGRDCVDEEGEDCAMRFAITEGTLAFTRFQTFDGTVEGTLTDLKLIEVTAAGVEIPNGLTWCIESVGL